MTAFHQQKNWFNNNCRWIYYAQLYIIKCIHNANDKCNDLSVILVMLVKLVTQLQSITSIQFIKLMQIYFELHSYFGGIVHYINGVEHIVNVVTNCDIFERLICMCICLLHEVHTQYHQRMLLSINTNVSVSILNVLSLAVYYINNCFKVVVNLMDVLLSSLKQVKNTIKSFKIHMNNDKLNDYNKVLFSYYHDIVILLKYTQAHVISKKITVLFCFE